jgi:hypothetical protein
VPLSRSRNVSREHGIKIPDDVKVRVVEDAAVEDAPCQMSLVLPARASSEELCDEELSGLGAPIHVRGKLVQLEAKRDILQRHRGERATEHAKATEYLAIADDIDRALNLLGERLLGVSCRYLRRS